MSSVLDKLLDPGRRWAMLICAICMVVVIALIDWWVRPYISIGFLYAIPVLLVSLSWPRYLIIVAGVICAVLQETLNFPESERIIRLVLTSIGFIATGLFVSELLRNREKILRLVEELQHSIQLRQDAEAQLQLLVDTSPAAIVTIDSKGEILVANAAARRLFAAGTEDEDQEIEGQSISSYLPTLQTAVSNQSAQLFRTSLQCRGQRRNGESFMAGIWFSNYATVSGTRLTAIIADLSDELVAHGASAVDFTLRNTSILISGVAHEVRNVGSAMRVIYKNLSRFPELSVSEDFRALDSLIHSLDKISTAGPPDATSNAIAKIRLLEVLDELRVLVDGSYSETGIVVNWTIPDSLPLVQADRFGLVQVFLNLASNSKRAMGASEKKVLNVAISCEAHANTVIIRFADTGTGVRYPEKLFRPFQPGTGVTGLGLYVSRSTMRSFGGDLIYEPTSEGSCFAVVLPVPVPVSAENQHA